MVRGDYIQSHYFTYISQDKTCVFLCSDEGREGVNFLLKTKSKVKCLINNEVINYGNGLEAYEHLHQKFILSSIEVKDNILVLELIPIVDENEWKDVYKKQFGAEPSFF